MALIEEMSKPVCAISMRLKPSREHPAELVLGVRHTEQATSNDGDGSNEVDVTHLIHLDCVYADVLSQSARIRVRVSASPCSVKAPNPWLVDLAATDVVKDFTSS